MEQVIDAFATADSLEEAMYSNAPRPGWGDTRYLLDGGSAAQADIYWRHTYGERAGDGVTALVNIRPRPALVDVHGAKLEELVEASEDRIDSEHGDILDYRPGTAAQDVARFEVPLDPDPETVQAVVKDAEQLLDYYEELLPGRDAPYPVTTAPGPEAAAERYLAESDLEIATPAENVYVHAKRDAGTGGTPSTAGTTPRAGYEVWIHPRHEPFEDVTLPEDAREGSIDDGHTYRDTLTVEGDGIPMTLDVAVYISTTPLQDQD